jgi:hypothetical protein
MQLDWCGRDLSDWNGYAMSAFVLLDNHSNDNILYIMFGWGMKSTFRSTVRTTILRKKKKHVCTFVNDRLIFEAVFVLFFVTHGK